MGWIISDILIPNGLLTHFTVVSMLCYSCRDVITSCRAAPVALIPRYAGYGWFKLIQIYNLACKVLHGILSLFSYTITNTNNDNLLLFTRQTSELVPNDGKSIADCRGALESVTFAMYGSKHVKISFHN